MAEFVLGVGQLNEYVRRQLAADPMLRAVRVRGEISGFKRHYSGHLYFALKDQDARVQCVMFRQSAMTLNFQPRDGMQVTVTANASLFVRDGSFQLYCDAMAAEGTGDLFQKFEQLKAKLMAEGLFDPSLKQPLPLAPKRIGVVTSTAGAALRDIIRVARRRNPGVSILVAAAAVQGPTAAQEIADALDRLNQYGCVDVILCGRGGGSIEDLWAFNEEVVARAIYRSNVPVVSCVGHETDFTIADFVADVRAATPSQATELAVPNRSELLYQLRSMRQAMDLAQSRRIELLRARILRLAASPVLSQPGQMLLASRREQLSRMTKRLHDAQSRRLDSAKNRFTLMARALSGLNPAAVLSRGYAVIEGPNGIAAQASELSLFDQIGIIMQGGRADATVNWIQLEADSHGKT